MSWILGNPNSHGHGVLPWLQHFFLFSNLHIASPFRYTFVHCLGQGGCQILPAAQISLSGALPYCMSADKCHLVSSSYSSHGHVQQELVCWPKKGGCLLWPVVSSDEAVNKECNWNHSEGLTWVNFAMNGFRTALSSLSEHMLYSETFLHNGYENH